MWIGSTRNLFWMNGVDMVRFAYVPNAGGYITVTMIKCAQTAEPFMLTAYRKEGYAGIREDFRRDKET